ncbi:hypothetical protein GGX14DRAFT_524665 [Mycena pura]|uniref:T6SS Phospholipase effector Tle1-like catalytic domain-containing protein n=1 Tax=Mycena pura TaxID=153505 RepID=A0AAD6V381_9AGAR|nr:hypothetical protein GGX14DRAFT_524665 [Mycena pura]
MISVATKKGADAVKTKNAGNGEGVTRKERVANENGPDSVKRRGGQLERPGRICGCTCQVDCNCNCTCACQDHCVCLNEACSGKCGAIVSRNLVLSIDGTSNQFGKFNTNVVELHSRIDSTAEAKQSKFYNCGIGTYVPEDAKATPKYASQWISNAVDLAIAKRFKQNVLEAYRWLSHMYRPGDKIFIFGFSRGAYQARTLAAMIEKIGLVDQGNESMIPFAYEIYLERHKGKVISDEKKTQKQKEESTDAGVSAKVDAKKELEVPKGKVIEDEKKKEEEELTEADELARKFKETCSRPVRIHFAGLWDTVSSVGLVRGKPLPLTSTAQHICIVRHALALDERRVKFLPEYVGGGGSSWSASKSMTSDVKEVWFPGTHSDIGGGLKENVKLNLSSVPLLWMENEATLAGLRLRRRISEVSWAKDLKDMCDPEVSESLTKGWWLLECMHLTRLTFETPHQVTKTPHLGAGRIIVPGQRIHISVAFKKTYKPRATFLLPGGIEWESFLGKEIETSSFEWLDQLGDKVEKNLFDATFMIQAIESLWSLTDTTGDNFKYLHQRLAFMALSGQLAVTYLSTLKRGLSDVKPVVEFFERLQKQQPVTFDADLAALLEHQASLLIADGKVGKGLEKFYKAQTIRLKIAHRVKNAPKDATDALEKCLTTLTSTDRNVPDWSADILEVIQDAVKFQPSTAIARGEPHQPLANSLHCVGIILRHLGCYEDAVKAHTKAIDLLRKLATTDPTVTKYLAQSLHHLGSNLSILKRYEEAIEVKREAVEFRRHLAEADRTAIKDLARSLHNLAIDLTAVGKNEDAVAADKEAVKKLMETNPSSIKDLCGTLQTLCINLRALGRPGDALTFDQDAVTLCRRLAQTDPTATKNLVWALHSSGMDLRVLGRPGDALTFDQDAVTLCRGLVKKDPSITNLKDLSRALHDLGVDHEEAMYADEEAVKLRQELAKTDPTVEEDLVASLEGLGYDYYTLGHNKEAAGAASEAVELRRKMAEGDPLATRDLAQSLSNLGIYCSAAGHNKAAVNADKEAVELRRKLPTTDHTVTKDLIQSLVNLGVDYRALDRHEYAVRHDKEVVELRRKLVEMDPTVTSLNDLARALHNLGIDLRAVGRDEDALYADEEAAKLRREHAKVDDTVNEDLVASLENLGRDYRALHRNEEAVRADVEVVQLRRRLAGTDHTATKNLATSLQNLGCSLLLIGRHEEALQAHEESIELFRKLVTTDSTLTVALAQSMKSLGFNLGADGRRQDWVRTNREAVKLHVKIREPTLDEQLGLAETLQSFASSLRTVGLHDVAYRASAKGNEIYRKMSEIDPLSTGASLHALASGLRCAGVHEDAVLAEQRAVDLYHKPAQTRLTFRAGLIRALQSLAGDLRALGLGEDAARTHEQMVLLKSSGAQPEPLVELQLQLYSLTVKL